MIEAITQNWELLLTAIIAVAAFICAFLEAPTEDSSTIYNLIYKGLNYLAFNVNKATNADDALNKKL